MAYIFTEPQIGYLPLASVDSGITPPNQSTAIPTPPNKLGQVVRAVDPTYGSGEFILLAGIASTAVGDLVIYNTTSWTTTRYAGTANTGQPVAVAMSANVAATTFGWYQIDGMAVINKSAVKISPNVALFVAATAVVSPTAVSGKQLLGARSANAATVVSATATVNVVINRPHVQGQAI